MADCLTTAYRYIHLASDVAKKHPHVAKKTPEVAKKHPRVANKHPDVAKKHRRVTKKTFKRGRFQAGTLETTGEVFVPSMLLSLKELYSRFQVWVTRVSSACRRATAIRFRRR